VPPGLDDLAQAGIDALDRVCRIQLFLHQYNLTCSPK
jgi:hypothetical protein